jgi:hypothetical protein
MGAAGPPSRASPKYGDTRDDMPGYPVEGFLQSKTGRLFLDHTKRG